jgi:hypothetical protein
MIVGGAIVGVVVTAGGQYYTQGVGNGNPVPSLITSTGGSLVTAVSSSLIISALQEVANAVAIPYQTFTVTMTAETAEGTFTVAEEITLGTAPAATPNPDWVTESYWVDGGSYDFWVKPVPYNTLMSANSWNPSGYQTFIVGPNVKRQMMLTQVDSKPGTATPLLITRNGELSSQSFWVST